MCCVTCACCNSVAHVSNPQVVMYDEPTAGLDPVASTVVEDLIRSLQSQRGASTSAEGISSYIVVTHQHSTIRRAVDRLIFLHEVGTLLLESRHTPLVMPSNPFMRRDQHS